MNKMYLVTVYNWPAVTQVLSKYSKPEGVTETRAQAPGKGPVSVTPKGFETSINPGLPRAVIIVTGLGKRVPGHHILVSVYR